MPASESSWTHLGHVANHPARDLVAREGRRLAQDGDVAPGNLEGSHNAFQQGGLPTSTGSKEAITVWSNMENAYHSEQAR